MGKATKFWWVRHQRKPCSCALPAAGGAHPPSWAPSCCVEKRDPKGEPEYSVLEHPELGNPREK